MGAVLVGDDWRWTRPSVCVDATRGRMVEEDGSRGVSCKHASQEGTNEGRAGRIAES
jgi:hypothetical protein